MDDNRGSSVNGTLPLSGGGGGGDGTTGENNGFLHHHHHHGGDGGTTGGPAGEFQKVHSLLVDGGDRFGVSAVTVDLQEELIWMGNQGVFS
jgi:hypothetical protein